MNPRSERGYALLMAVLAAAMVALALSVAIPSAWTRGRREMELEMIFRGEQYKIAVGRYFRKHNRAPLKIDELLRTNDRSYLRKEFPDPMSPDGKWRLIRLGPDGRLVGSVESPPEVDPLGRGNRSSRSGRSSSRSRAAASSASSTLPILGVGSKSTEHSYRVYNDYETYEGWEFYFDPKEAAKKEAKKAAQQQNRDARPLGRKKPD